VRNSSLVESLCADNVTGLRYKPKLWNVRKYIGRRALCRPVKVYRKEHWRYHK